MRYWLPLLAAVVAVAPALAQYPTSPTPVVPVEKFGPRQGQLGNLPLPQTPSAPILQPPQSMPAPPQNPQAPQQPPAAQLPASQAPRALPASLVAPARPLAAPGGLTNFDYHQAEVHWVNSRWQLQAGNVWLKDFGGNEHEAREALRVIQNLHLTQRGAIGSPTPIMEFWLADGKAPHTQGSGLRVYPIDPNSVRVEQVGNQWCVRDNRQLLFNFGVQQEAARQAVNVVQGYGFTQIGYVGYPHPSMIYFLGGATSSSAHATSLHTPHMAVNHVSRTESGSTPVQAQPVTVAGQPGSAPGQLAKGTPEKTSAAESLHARVYAQQLARGVRQLGTPIMSEASRFRFDPRQITVRQDSERWRLVNGNYIVADFGADSMQAQRALQLIRHYGCDEQCWVGKAAPAFTYFLVNGHAPLGVPTGTPGQTFRPDKVAVQRTVQGWCVSDGGQLAIPMGASQEDAQALARAIQRYHFDFASSLGPNMTFLARTR